LLYNKFTTTQINGVCP